ncbi:MAG: ABC transporter ATP-binding protein [Saccharofermentanales bacterium]
MSILKIDNISFSYKKNKPVLKNINFEFEKGTTYSITGKSGSGKTTLLSLISGLETVQEGKIFYTDIDLAKIDKEKYRSRDIGVVFQSFNLLPHLTALENVVLSLDISGNRLDARSKKKKAMMLLNKVGLDEDLANRRILKLSGGEQQRVAIARAISYDPDIIIADEPSGNLDGATETEIMDLLVSLAKNDDKCVIIVTHSPTVSERTDVTYQIG